MKSDSISIGVIQTTSTDDWRANLAQIQQLAAPLLVAKSGTSATVRPDLLTLPENALFLRTVRENPVPRWNLQSEPIAELAAWVKSIGVPLHVGSAPLVIDEKLFNATLWIGADGSVTTPYQKIHLFDVDVEGQARERESATFTHGTGPRTVVLNGWKIGLTVCYDLRFAEMFVNYHLQQADLILVPSAFLVPTGQAHWEVLLRARAIESQCFVVAAAQTGRHGATRQTYGHSLVVDPWGAILADLGEDPSARTVTLTKSAIQKVRTQIPMLGHRRLS